MSNVRVTAMPGGKVQKRQRVVTTWRCSVCGTDYNALKSADRCAAMPVEPRFFKKGDRVTWRSSATCDHGRNRNRSFRLKGTVVRIRKPEPPDEEYNNKWLRGALTGKHVRMYEISFPCFCKKPRSILLYAAEMEKLP